MILSRIIEEKRKEIEEARRVKPQEDLIKEIRSLSVKSQFKKSISRPHHINLIAEIKKASPSAGVICRDFAPVTIARQYEKCGADAISVLTDEKYFQGKLEYIDQVKHAVDLPILRKDFIIDIWQVYESRVAGADAILLIAEALKPAEEITRAGRCLRVEKSVKGKGMRITSPWL